MDKEKFLTSGLIEQYVLGLTNPEESREVEHYADMYPEVRQEIRAMQQAMEEYARQYSIPPPPHMKEKILREIDAGEAMMPDRHSDRSVVPGAGRRQSINWVTTTAILGMVALAFFSFSLFQQKKQSENRFESLAARFDQYKGECERSKQQAAETAQLYAFLSDAQTRQVRLSGTALAPEAATVAFLNEEKKQVYLSIVNLPPAPSGKTYQLWADVEGEMINMGLLDHNNPNLQAVTFIERAESLNITLEPEGGSDHPTVELLYVNGKV